MLSFADRSSESNHTRRHLRSWKSSNTLNDDSNLDDDDEDDEVADVMPAIPVRRPAYRMMSPTPGDYSTMALSRFRTAPAGTCSPERPWSSQDASANAAHLARRE